MSENAEWAALPHTAYRAASPPGINVLAIASLACAIAGWVFLPVVGQVLGLVFGYSARRQIAQTGEGGSALATAAIVLGWVYVGIIVAAMALLTVIIVMGLASEMRAG